MLCVFEVFLGIFEKTKEKKGRANAENCRDLQKKKKADWRLSP